MKYKCVPFTTKALSKTGWKTVNELNIGDQILSYNSSTDKLEWDTISNINIYNDAEILQIVIPGRNINVKCTEDHKWVLKFPNESYPDNLIPTNEVTNNLAIRTNSKIGLDFNEEVVFSESGNLVEDLLNMNFGGVTNFLMQSVKFFTHKDPIHLQGRFRFFHDVENQELFNAVEIAAYLLGYRMYLSNNLENGKYICNFTKTEAESTRNFNVALFEIGDVWCPETNNKTWVMKENDVITITGNSC